MPIPTRSRSVKAVENHANTTRVADVNKKSTKTPNGGGSQLPKKAEHWIVVPRSESTASTKLPLSARSGVPQTRTTPTSAGLATNSQLSTSSRLQPKESNKTHVRTNSNIQAAPLTSKPLPAKPSSSRSQSVIPPRAATSINTYLPVVKPAFSTYQQHFSPKKKSTSPTPGVLIANHRLNPSTEHSDESQSLSRLADELLQLQLVYHCSARRLGEYEQSIRSSLRKEYTEVITEQARISSLESEQKHAVALASFHDWLKTSDREATFTEIERIQALSDSVNLVDELCRPGSPFNIVTEHFDVWYEEVAEVIARRINQHIPASEELLIVRPLDNSWSSTCQNLIHQLQRNMVSLSNVGVSLVDQNLSETIRKHVEKSQLMLDEILFCKGVEMEVLDMEENWTKATLEQLTSAPAQMYQDTMLRRPIWETGSN